MSVPIRFHVTTDLVGRFRAIGLIVAEQPNAAIVSCPGCTERQRYLFTADGWRGPAFLHDDGCPHFRAAHQAFQVMERPS